ncbi:MAG TPA: PD-(D/E)XK nuclease family protein [Gemmataceae bacterium]|nr:PD-(D/E)XK nuclease family protein [Gemmataceae bacterium]
MPAIVRIVCGPAGSGKTTRLLERYRSVVAASVGGALWLGPTHRSVEALRLRLMNGLTGCLAPNLFTFQDFAEEVIRVNDPSARPLSNLQRRLLANELVAQLHNRGALSHFGRVVDTRGFTETVFSFLAELKRNEVWPEQFAEVVGSRALGAKAEQGAVLYAEYQKLLIAHKLYDLEGRFWYARDLLTRGQFLPFEAVRAVFVDGFTDFTRTQQEILETLCGRVDEFWLALVNEPDDERAELFTRPRTTLGRWRHLGPEIEWRERVRAAGRTGLGHVERQLFRPLRAVRQAAKAGDIVCIEAPGMLGEARMVARKVKMLLVDGVPADDILISLRDVRPYADLLREVFAEYGIPIDVEGAEPLTRSPAVATLLRALRLPDEDWPFPGVTALLRSGYFRPDWPEVRSTPEVAQQAEALLRLLGEPRKREAYLRSTDLWADKPPLGLEDEQAEESRRQRTHELATVCRPFLQHLFRAWDGTPAQATLPEHTAWLRGFADDLGIVRAAAGSPRDALALRRLWDELGQWARLDSQFQGREQTRDRAWFLRTLSAVAAEALLARTPRGPGRVRVLSAPLTRGLDAPYLFVMGLGERGFPRLAPPEFFFDEAERQALRQAGLDFACAADLMRDEMLLFYQVLTRARRRLVLSYPAVDNKGQALLPSMFLNTLLGCFREGAIPVHRQRMLIEGHTRLLPLCAAEYRVQSAAEALPADLMPADMAANLAAAEKMARQRLQSKEYSAYDGLLTNADILSELNRLFGSDKVYSPTALEDYIACPFRFFVGHVLRLEPLEGPREEVEHTKRGAAIHRALARLHQQLRDAGMHQPTPEVDSHLVQRLEEAVNEYAARSSPASEVLWRLEGRRLQRAVARYRAHWEKFLKPWLAQSVAPRPHLFEVAFGMPAGDGEVPVGPLVIAVDGVEVRIRGRIDRVDVADLPDGTGFWIIDYKTGRSGHYTAADLQNFQRLQLTLYALAVEQVLLADRNARPLGLAYWLVSDTGVKVALPAKDQIVWLNETEGWRTVRERLTRWVAELVAHIRRGVFPLKPRSKDCTATCNLSEVCRIAQSRAVEKTWELPLPVIS